MGLRLPVGGVTVLLGPPAERAAVLAAVETLTGPPGRRRTAGVVPEVAR